MKIGLFCHILPPAYFDRMTAVSTRGAYMQKRVRGIPAMVDLDERFRMMDLFDDYVQVLSLAAPPIVFASDFPFDPEKGTFNYRETLKDIDGLPISAAERTQIYEGNARKLLRLA